MTPEEAVRKVRACRNNYQCPNEQACFVLMRFVEKTLRLEQMESEQSDSESLQYFAAPTLGN